MTTIEAVLAMIPSLTDREREQVSQSLRITAPTPCQRNGHKYRKVDQVLPLLWGPKQTKLTCTVCGDTIVR